MTNQNKSKIKQILLDLIIVFVGVFLAFQLNTYKENIENNKLKKNLYNLILHEFEFNSKEINRTSTSISEFLETFKAQNENGEKPQIKPLTAFDLSNNMLILRSAFNSGHLENLHPQYVTNISQGSNFITRVSNYIDQYNKSVRVLLQNNDFDNDKFYGANGKLKKQYEWYITELEMIANGLTQLEAAITQGAIPDTKKLLD